MLAYHTSFNFANTRFHGRNLLPSSSGNNNAIQWYGITFRFAIIETEDGDRFIVGLDRIQKLVPGLEYGKKFAINLGGY